MAMVVAHNIPALQTYNVVNSTSSALQKSINKLSTGLRINSAADDAAGLAISEKMRAQVRGLDQAVGNSQDGISMIQTAEGALSETHSILQRMRELSVQAANDTLTNQDRGYIQEEVDQLREEITRIGNTTQFNKKKLLNGDAAVLWSSSDLDTKAVINGGLRTIDQFGQKNSVEGNYKIKIKAQPGQGEVQKTDIFTIKHKDVIDLSSKSDALDDVTASNLKTSVGDSRVTYTVDGAAAAAQTSAVLGTSLGTASAATAWGAGVSAAVVTSSGALSGANVELVATLKNYTTGATNAVATAQIAVSGRITYADGTTKDVGERTYDVRSADSAGFVAGTDILELQGDLEGVHLDLASASGLSDVWNNGAGKDTSAIFRATNTVSANAATGPNPPDTTFTVKSTYESGGTAQTMINDSTKGNNAAHTYNLDSKAIQGKNISLKQYYFDNGTLKTGSVNLSVAEDATATQLQKANLTTFKATEIGDTATENIHLRDLDKFWDTEGNFLLEDPQTITITQGDGKQASVTLYAYDTLGDVAKKFNDAIGKDLGQAEHISLDDTVGANKFATFVSGTGSENNNTSESVDGTFLIRSIVPGSNGTLSFSGNEAVINAFSLNTIQDAKESQYTVSVQDAHTGETVVDATRITGNKLIGKIHENVDVEFNAMAGVEATWNDTAKKFQYKSSDYETTLHLSDNTTVFQIGANEGEDMGINIGDMRSHALGLDSVNVTNRDSASRSITVIDNAIDKVSMQRAKLGAYQNRLEHTINNLTTASENLTAAESRIRDTDMAKEMMNFSKLQIMLQAGNSMLAQANQLPQNVLSLVR